MTIGLAFIRIGIWQPFAFFSVASKITSVVFDGIDSAAPFTPAPEAPTVKVSLRSTTTSFARSAA